LPASSMLSTAAVEVTSTGIGMLTSSKNVAASEVSMITTGMVTTPSVSVTITGSSNEKSNSLSLIAGVVVTVVLLLVIAMVAIVIALVVLRKMKSSIKVQLNSDGKNVSNPCYDWGELFVFDLRKTLINK